MPWLDIGKSERNAGIIGKITPRTSDALCILVARPRHLYSLATNYRLFVLIPVARLSDSSDSQYLGPSLKELENLVPRGNLRALGTRMRTREPKNLDILGTSTRGNSIVQRSEDFK